MSIWAELRAKSFRTSSASRSNNHVLWKVHASGAFQSNGNFRATEILVSLTECLGTFRITLWLTASLSDDPTNPPQFGFSKMARPVLSDAIKSNLSSKLHDTRGDPNVQCMAFGQAERKL